MRPKEDLLKELKKLGVDPTKKVRKPRSDAGEVRGAYKERSDKGKQRGSYINTAAKYKVIYEKMLHSHSLDTGDGADTLTRDNNDIFPPNQNRYFRLMRTKDREYMSSVVKPAHIEQARWRWLMAEYAEDPDKWQNYIVNLYFIDAKEITLWTYTEWAWAYVYHIGGRENKRIPLELQLKLWYGNYLKGMYNGLAQFDEKGEIKWTQENKSSR